MIKFFRTIRLRLLTQAPSDKVRERMLQENRFSRYFLYAIGEIPANGAGCAGGDRDIDR